MTIALLSVWVGTGSASAEAPATTATVLAAKAYPGIQLIQTDYTASVSVPTPVMDQTALDALFKRLVKQAQAGVISVDQNSVNEAVVSELTKAPFTYLKPTKKIITEPGSLSSVGTGWVITPDGYLVTAAHVVKADAAEMKREFALTTMSEINTRFVAGLSKGPAKFSDDQRERLGKVMAVWMARYITVKDLKTTVTAQIGVAETGSTKTGTTKTQQPHPVRIVSVGQPYPGKDVAVLKMDGETTLPTLPLGSDDDVATGSTLYVAGYPAASTFSAGMSKDSQVQPTVTQGPLTAVKQTEDGMPVFQTQAPASPGNSGGPVLDETGRVVGVLVAGATAPDGTAVAGQEFVLPISVVREQLDAKTVTPAASETSTVYGQALDAYYVHHYSAALPLFQRVLQLYPRHPYAQAYVDKANAAIAAGRDETPAVTTSPATRLMLALGVGGLVVAIAVTLGAWGVHHRRSRRRPTGPIPLGAGAPYPAAAPYAPGQGYPAGPYPPAFAQPSGYPPPPGHQGHQPAAQSYPAPSPNGYGYPPPPGYAAGPGYPAAPGYPPPPSGYQQSPGDRGPDPSAGPSTGPSTDR